MQRMRRGRKHGKELGPTSNRMSELRRHGQGAYGEERSLDSKSIVKEVVQIKGEHPVLKGKKKAQGIFRGEEEDG